MRSVMPEWASRIFVYFFPELSGFVADCRFRWNRWKLRDATRQRVTREEISAAFRSHRKALHRHVTLPETGHRGLRHKQTLKASDIHPGTQISCYFFSTRVYNSQLWTSYRFIRHCFLKYLRKCRNKVSLKFMSYTIANLEATPTTVHSDTSAKEWPC